MVISTLLISVLYTFKRFDAVYQVSSATKQKRRLNEMEIDAVNVIPSFKALFWTFSDGSIISDVTYASIPQRTN